MLLNKVFIGKNSDKIIKFNLMEMGCSASEDKIKEDKKDEIEPSSEIQEVTSEGPLSLEDAARGCIVGAFVGDAAGAVLGKSLAIKYFSGRNLA